MTEREALQAARKEYWTSVLAQTGGNIAEAARMAGVHRATVHLRKVQFWLSSAGQRERHSK